METNRYEKFEVKEYTSSVPQVFILDRETGDIFSFDKSYAQTPPKFKLIKIVSMKDVK